MPLQNPIGPRRFERRHVSLQSVFLVMAIAALIFSVPFAANGANQKQKKNKNAASGTNPAAAGLSVTELNENEAILHALNRLGYGPRPGDVDRVRQMGLAKWIDAQLNPDSIDDSAMQARLEKYPTLKMSSAKLRSEFPQPQQAAKKEGVSLEEYRKEQQQMQQQANQQMAAAADSGDNGAAGQSNGQAATGGNANNNTMMAYLQVRTPQRIVAELSMAKMDRAIYSERQLYEQMVDFWFNHFNVFAGKGQDRYFLTAYDRDTIRPHAMGKFEDLLIATAKSPAMMFYLDNWLNSDPNAQQRMMAGRRGFFGAFGPPPGAQQQQNRRQFGVNENYGRELMELHTLGVDGGYTQQDVQEVAKCFTGWTIRQPQQGGEFFFNPALHVEGPKHVLGHTINAGGMDDGLAVIEILVHDPHTAHHISLQLAQHFVSDNPPPALVDRMAQTFQATNGDIKAILHTMIYSPEFWSRETYAAKIKSPFELVVSAARAVSADVDVPQPLVQWTARIGEPLYQCQPPTGYKDDATTWVNTGALLNRLNYTLTLANGRVRGTHVDVASLMGSGATTDPHTALDRAISTLLNGDVSQGTRATLEKQLDNPQVLQAKLDDPVRQISVGTVAGLVLGAPEFQRR
jgi:uncharacterized protein (DUF1800 family)